MNLSKNARRAILFAVCSVFALVRFWDLTSSCLWFDEIFSVHAAEHSWDSLFGFVAQDVIHPPFFYFLLKLWIAAGGESLFWLRFFPFFFSIIAPVPFILLCREMKLGFSTVLIALSFFAVNGSLIKYAQEVRMYSVLLCISLFSMWLFARFFNRGKDFWLLTIINILLVYTHYFGWLLVLSEVVAILFLQRIKIGRVLLMFAITLVCFLPWVFAILRFSAVNSDIKQNIGWIAKPGFSSIFELAVDVIEPFYYQQSSAEPTSIFIISIPILLLIAAAAIVFFTDLKNGEEKSGIYVLALLSFVPIMIAFIASWLLPVSVWGSRHLIIVFTPITMLIAIFLSRVKFKFLQTAFVSLIFLLFGIAFIIRLNTKQPQFIWCAWENLAANLRTAEKDSAELTKIYVFEDLVAYHVWFALRDSDKFETNVVKGIDGLTEDTAYFLPRGFDDIRTIDENGLQDERFWIAFRTEKWVLTSPPLSNLISKGYTPGEPLVLEAGNEKAFLLEVKKTER